MFEIPYLRTDDHPTEVVRCPVHGFIGFSKNERRVVDHAVFQRLRHVRQLAMEYLVYPGAMHSRFEHSLGVMELSGRAFDVAVRKHHVLIEEELKRIPELQTDTLARARQILRLSGLLHDVGHPAFSHAAEKFIPGGDHEKVSLHVVKDVLGSTIDEVFFSGASGLMARILEKSKDTGFLRQFVSGEWDMDRTDYLLRDSKHCGVDYGIFEFRRLIESITVVTNPDTHSLQLALERGGEHSFEALILARYQMNTQVYFHKIRRIYDHYLNEYMKLWAPNAYKTLADVLKYDDETVMAEIRKDAGENNERSMWAKRIIERRHHRVVYETGDNADIPKLKKARRLLDELQKHFADIDIFIDDCKISIHKLAVPGDQEEEKTEDLYIREKDGRQVPLGGESPIIGKVPKVVRSVRIFADALGEPLEKIRAKIKEVESSI